MHTEAFERAVGAVEEAVDLCRGQELSAEQFGWRTVDTFLAYLDEEDPRDDVESFIAYAVEWAEVLGDVSLFADQALAGIIERRLRWCLQRQGLRFKLDELLHDLDRGLCRGDGEQVARLASLCANGASLRIFRAMHWGREVIDLAARHRLPGALYEALHPGAPGRLAHWRRDGGLTYLAALDHLGHLAADPIDRDGAADAARGRLVDLTRYIATAGDAAIRLPVHLVSDQQTAWLLDFYEQRCEAMKPRSDDDAYEPGDMSMRETAVIRTVLFQINDAARLRDVVAA